MATSGESGLSVLGEAATTEGEERCSRAAVDRGAGGVSQYATGWPTRTSREEETGAEGDCEKDSQTEDGHPEGKGGLEMGTRKVLVEAGEVQ